MLPAAKTDMPEACSNIIVESPQTTQAPDRSSKRRTKDQPLTPALSARHASPEIPPTKDSRITIQTGISISACCSFVIACPLNAKTRHKGRVWCVGACRSLRSHLSKMATFYRWIPVAATLF